uniref:Glutathione transferase n=1 Tax=Opuntia streptacantha TaxID=393608 RepID=A0A7C9DRM0_OPUST
MPTAKLHQLKMAATQMSFLSTTSRRCFTVDSVILSPHLPFYTTNSLSFSLIAGKHPHFLSLRLLPALPLPPRSRRRTTVFASTMAPTTGCSQEALPPPLDSTSDPPPIFDGTTRLYISYTCPYAQRVWITRNCKGLQEQIKLVPIDLQNRPAWYKEKVYPANKDPAKKVFADVLFSYSDSFHKTVTASFKEEGVKAETDAAFDFMEDALSKFSDGPFFLGQFSLVDIAYIPFFERYIPFFLEMKNCDLTVRRPKLAEWIEEMDKIDGYKQTKTDPKMLVESYKKRFLSKV